MAVTICRQRIRGDWMGILTCVFIICCWGFAVYSTNFTFFPRFFRFHGELKTYLQGGHIVLSILTLCTMLQCIASDPGKLHEVSRTDLGWEYCDHCQKHRPPRSHHCRRCGRCVRKMDHHCPWINNCIGEDNVANFTQFIFYSMIMSLFTLALCIAYWFDWLPSCSVCDQSDPDVDFNVRIEIVCLTFISLLFGAFTVFMLVDRIILISADVTTIELMGDKQAIRKSWMNPKKPTSFKLFSRAFGTSNVVDWLMPYARRNIRMSHEFESYNWQEFV